MVVADPMLHGHGALHSFSALFGLHTSSCEILDHLPTPAAAQQVGLLLVLALCLSQEVQACIVQAHQTAAQVLSGPGKSSAIAR